MDFTCAPSHQDNRYSLNIVLSKKAALRLQTQVIPSTSSWTHTPSRPRGMAGYKGVPMGHTVSSGEQRPLTEPAFVSGPAILSEHATGPKLIC